MHRTQSVNKDIIKRFNAKTETPKACYFPHSVLLWNHLSDENKSVESINKFKISLPNLISLWKTQSLLFMTLTRLRLRFSHSEQH